MFSFVQSENLFSLSQMRGQTLNYFQVFDYSSVIGPHKMSNMTGTWSAAGTL